MTKLTKKQKDELIKKYGKVSGKEELFEKLKESQERMVFNLIKAWETAPDDPEIRKELLDAIEKALNVREKLYKDILEKEPPELEESYNKLQGILDEGVS